MQTQHEADCRAWQHYCQIQGKGAKNERKYNPQGGNFLAPSPSKRMMVLRFRAVLRGGRAGQRLLMTAVSDAS